MSVVSDMISGSLTLNMLKEKGVTSTTAVMCYFKDSDTFLSWSNFLSSTIRQRDDEDGYKLHHGIDIAIKRGTLAELTETERAAAAVAYESVDVLGKTPTEVSDFIWEQVKRKKEALLAAKSLEENGTGELIALCGLSGTGKVWPPLPKAWIVIINCICLESHQDFFMESSCIGNNLCNTRRKATT